jgi:hypothetical protein
MATEEPIVAVEPVPEPTIAAEPPASEIDHSEPKAAEEEKKTKQRNPHLRKFPNHETLVQLCR